MEKVKQFLCCSKYCPRDENIIDKTQSNGVKLETGTNNGHYKGHSSELPLLENQEGQNDIMRYETDEDDSVFGTQPNVNLPEIYAPVNSSKNYERFERDMARKEHMKKISKQAPRGMKVNKIF